MKTADRKVSGACPSFFRALCRTASEGGESGYSWAGYQLAGAIHDLEPYEVEHDEWLERVQALESLICPKDDSGWLMRPDDALVLEWLDRELPRCMALAPRRRRHQFLKGLYRYVRDEEQPLVV